MQYMEIQRDSTSQMIEFDVWDSSSAVGAKLAGLTFETGSLVAYYNRQNQAGAATAISLVTMTKGTWTSGGFIAIDATNMPGRYQLCLPNAALAAAAGVNFVTVVVQGAANMVGVDICIRLRDVLTEGQAACDAALVANNLDHLLKTQTAGADMTAEVTDLTIISRLFAAGDTSTFDPSTMAISLLADDDEVAAAVAAHATIAAMYAATVTNAVGADLAADVLTLLNNIGTAIALDGGAASLAGMLTKLADDNAGADYDATTDSQEKMAGTMAAFATTEDMSAATWDRLLTAILTSGSIGKLLKDYVDAAISSRSVYAGGAVASVTGAVASVTAGVTLAADAVDANALKADAVAEIVDGLEAGNVLSWLFNRSKPKIAVADNTPSAGYFTLTYYDMSDVAIATQVFTKATGARAKAVDE